MSADVQESDAQFRAAWKHFADRLPYGRQAALDGVYAVFGGIPNPFFNLLFLDEGSQNARELVRRLNTGTTWANQQGFPWMICLRDDDAKSIEHAEDALAAAGFHPVMRLTGMIADQVSPQERLVPELEFRPVRDTENRQAIADVNSLAYGMTLGERSNLDGEPMWDDDAFGVVGYLRGEAVSCAATLLVEERLYVGWVATLPEHRRKGYAAAAMRRSLEDAVKVHGWRKSVLHATPPGRPIYERMGYRPVAEYTLYSLDH